MSDKAAPLTFEQWADHNLDAYSPVTWDDAHKAFHARDAEIVALTAQVAELEREKEAMMNDHTRRWSFHDSGEGRIQICRGDHERGTSCQWENYTREQVYNATRTELDAVRAAAGKVVKEWNEPADPDVSALATVFAPLVDELAALLAPKAKE